MVCSDADCVVGFEITVGIKLTTYATRNAAVRLELLWTLDNPQIALRFHLVPVV